MPESPPVFDPDARRRLSELGVTAAQIARLEEILPFLSAQAVTRPRMADVRDELLKIHGPAAETLAALERMLAPAGTAPPARVEASLRLQRSRVLEGATPALRSLVGAVQAALDELPDETRERALVEAVDLMWRALQQGWDDEYPLLRDAETALDLRAQDPPAFPFSMTGKTITAIAEVVFEVFKGPGASPERALRMWHENRMARGKEVFDAHLGQQAD